ncbi:MAG: sodium:calcium antiporter, partial [Phycisphaerae bacterium]|nr:sodium:calcium antiporter [Phycisphaerae bacterium]
LSVHWSRQHSLREPNSQENNGPKPSNAGAIVKNLLFILAGLALVVCGSELLIGSAKVVCVKHGVPQTVIAGTLVAFGTSLPELVTAITSLIKGHSELLVGNVIGADILNVLFVIGAAATAKPLQIDQATLWLMAPMMLFVLFCLRGYIMSGRDRFHRWQGIPLLACYAAFVFLSLYFFGGSH